MSVRNGVMECSPGLKSWSRTCKLSEPSLLAGSALFLAGEQKKGGAW